MARNLFSHNTKANSMKTPHPRMVHSHIKVEPNTSGLTATVASEHRACIIFQSNPVAQHTRVRLKMGFPTALE
jgi:hypothetical protein